VLAAKAGRHQWQISVSDTAGCVWQTKQQRTSNWSQTCDLLLSSGVAHMQHTQHTQHCMAHSVTQACLLLFPAIDTARGCRRNAAQAQGQVRYRLAMQKRCKAWMQGQMGTPTL